MAARDIPITTRVDLTISKDSYEKLAAAKRSDSSGMTAIALGKMASDAIENYANGGIQVRCEWLKRMEDALGKAVSNDVQLSEAVTKLAGRENGQFVISAPIEPALWPSLVEFANVRGLTVEQVIDDTAHRMIRDSLAFYLNSELHEPVIYVTEEEAAKLAQILGKRRFTGKDILAKLAPAPPPLPAAEETPRLNA